MTVLTDPIESLDQDAIRHELDRGAFSGASEAQLTGYYRYALRRFEHACQTDMIAYLLEHFSHYLDLDRTAAACYRQVVFQQRLVSPPSFLERYLSEIQAAQPSYRTLITYQQVSRIILNNKDEQQVCDELFKIGFNELSFIDHCRKVTLEQLAALDLAEQIGYLRDQRLRWQTISASPRFTDWPSPAHWLAGWASEKIADLQLAATAQPTTPKVRLELSMAQLGCLLWVLYEAGVLGNIPLQTLFRQVLNGIATKRRDEGSAGSLSKCYYHIDQKTAATVRDLLLRLADRITRHFFPV